jgi:amidohydrolase
MIEAGCMRTDPIPEAIFAIHTRSSAMTGTFHVNRGPVNQSCDNIRITIKSPGGHGATPHRCGDPIITAAELLVQLQTAVSRFNNCMMPAVLTFGSIHGGNAPNIIPQEVVMEGTLRTLYRESRETIRDAVCRISEHVGAAMCTQVEVEFIGIPVPSVVNNDRVVDRAEKVIRELFGADAIQRSEFPGAGSEDFALYLEHCPGAMISLGTQSADDPDTSLSLHSSKTRFDERSLIYAAALFCRFVEDYLQ